MVTSSGVATRRIRRRGEGGFTLIECIVAVAILAIIGVSVTTLFSVGYKVTSPGGPQTRLFDAHGLMVLEQSLGQDGARAACVQVPPTGVTYGSCSATGFLKVGCPKTDLCIGWPQVSDSSCHVADYTVASSTAATRTEYVVSGGLLTTLKAIPLAREAPVSLAISTVATVTPPGESYLWIRSISLSIASSGVANGPSQTLTLHPIATDPAAASAAITSGGRAC